MTPSARAGCAIAAPQIAVDEPADATRIAYLVDRGAGAVALNPLCDAHRHLDIVAGMVGLG